MRSMLLIGILATALSGCAAPAPEPVLAEPAPLPRFSPGDSYDFSNQTADRVTAIRDQRIEWRTGAGSFITTRNPLLPPLAWSTPAETGTRRTTARPGALFPLEVGQGTTFSATVIRRARAGGRRQRVQEKWRCGVNGSAVVPTAVGRFAAYQVACTMHDSDGRSARRTMWYAPALGYPVRIDDPAGTRVLRGFTTGDPALTDAAQAARWHAVQTALTRDVSGERTTWRDLASHSAGQVEPVRTVRSDAYGWCRDYRERMVAAARRYTLLGTACHSPGRWQLVDVRPVGGRPG